MIEVTFPAGFTPADATRQEEQLEAAYATNSTNLAHLRTTGRRALDLEWQTDVLPLLARLQEGRAAAAQLFAPWHDEQRCV